jgi:uncharacterized repeat protein (TIGR01451 family)
LLAAAAFGVIFVAASGAAPSPCPIPGNFEIDGDMTQQTCAPGADDWNTPNIGVQATTQGGTYSTSGKDGHDPSTWTSSGHTPDKTNFAQEYATSRVVNGHFFVYVAWERTATSGTQGYAIEISNAGSNVAADGTPQPNRASGGNVFYISSQGSSPPAFNSACTYSSQSNYGQTCTTSNASVTAAINTASMSDPLNNTTQPAGAFFEVALDVTTLTGIAPSCPGPSAATVYLRSITGQTKDGNLKGYMAPLSVAPDSTCVPPPITTTATPGGSTNLPGTAQHDEVTVGTQAAPGVGSVKFFLCSPSEVTANGGDCKANGTQVGSAVTLNASGNGTSGIVNGASTPNDLAPGKYCWRADFTPSANDHNYLAGSHTNSDTECFTIIKASPAISTNASRTGGGVVGTGTTCDSATLSGSFNGTGTITFTLKAPNNSSSQVGSPVTVTGDGTYQSPSCPALTQVGTYTWSASYSGDSLNNGAIDNGNNESVTSIKASPSIKTQASVTGNGIVGTDSTSDTATVSGGDNPTGTIQFSITDPNNNTTTVGSPVTVNGDGTYNAPSSVALTLVGTYTWSASYSGDSLNNGAIDNGDNESITSNPTTPSITTEQAPASGSVGDTFKDKATLSGTFRQSGKGSITWTLYPNDDCSGTPLGTDMVSVDDNGTFETPNGVTVDAGGTYYWVASFSGDATNGSATSGCADEPVVVHGAAIHILKTADAAEVKVGGQIGFTMTVWNSGDGDAHGVKLNDVLPTTPGLAWTIDKQGAGWGSSCSIAAGVLSCGGSSGVPVPAGTTQSASTFTVHITSTTTAATAGDCPASGVVDNTGSVTTTNDGSDQSSASTCVQAMVDLSITKSGSPATQQLGAGNITWTIVVTNHGPNADTGVKITDPMPGGNTFVSASASPHGTCTGGGVLTCDLGTMAADESVTITLVTTPSAAGAQTNTVNVSGNRPETNTTNNSATATVEVTAAPITPPQVFCVAVSKVTPKQLFVGRKTMLNIHVTKQGKAVKGIHVQIKGPKLNVRTKASNSKGAIKQTVKMKKAGVLIFTPIASKKCNTKRVGVTNVFTPPVTG